MAKTTAASDRGKFAFQCKHCGFVERAEAAGENEVPGSCSSCREGANNPDNWVKLADLSDAELKKGFPIHGLTRADVVEHAVKGKAAEPKAKGKTHARHVTERVGSKDRG